MSVRVTITDGPLKPAPSAAGSSGPSGARLVFEGIVREKEGDRAIQALDYDAYEPMATEQLTALAEELLVRFGLHTIDVEHSRGRVPVGACSFRLTITSSHRPEALAAMGEFIDRMKRDVPIWKKPVP